MKHLKAKGLAIALSLAMVFGTLAAVPAKADETAKYKDGAYTASATVSPDEYEDFDAYGIDVSVTVSDGKITDVSVSNMDEITRKNKSYVNDAMHGYDDLAGVRTQIISKNSAEGIDSVSEVS